MINYWYYKSSKNAWQTSSLFKDWYNDLFIPHVTRYLESKNLCVKALFLVDNATFHITKNMFTANANFKIIYFHSNNTPLLQLLDKNMIKSFKQRYRKHLLTILAAKCNNGGMISALENINLKDVTFLSVQAWNELPQSVIQNSF